MTLAPRNHLIDLARVGSVGVVVVFHCLLYQLSTVDGQLVITPWAPDRGWWVASWFAMIIPLFFVAGGFAHAVMTSRVSPGGLGYATYLVQRGGRFVGPLVLFLGVTTLLWTIAAWVWDANRVSELSRQFDQLLWFIAVYLILVGIAPVLVRVHDRWRGWELVPLAAGAAAVDTWAFLSHDPALLYLNLLTVWPFCHQLGVGYQRGWLRRGPSWLPWAALGLAAVGIPVLVVVVGYPASAVGFADIPVANVLPPTLAMAILAVGQLGVLALAQRAGVLRSLSAEADKRLRVAGALLMTAYLWHIPCILVAGAALFGLSRLVPPASPVLMSQVSVTVVTLLLVSMAVPLIGRLEYRLIPKQTGHAVAAPVAFAGYLALCAGVVLVWLNGNVLHPANPLGSMGLALTALGTLLLARARVRGK